MMEERQRATERRVMMPERERVNEFGVALDRRRDRRSYPLCGATAEDDTWTSVDWREKLHFSRMKEHQQIDSIFVFLYIPAKQTFFANPKIPIQNQFDQNYN